MPTTVTPLEQLNRYIREHKLRRTYEREQLLSYIHTIDGHFTALSLYNDTYSLYHISRASIYNILELFLAAGIIIRHPFPGEEAQYETTQRAATHHHRICTCCGTVKEFTDQKFNRSIRARSFSAFDTRYHAVYLYGICKKCQNRLSGKSKPQKK